MNPENIGPDFLKQKYDKPASLHLTPEVEKAVKRKESRSGEKVSQKPQERIQTYIERLENIFNPPKIKDDPSFERQKRNMEMLKDSIFNKYVTKLEDVPDGYLEKQLRERGLSGDYSQAGEKEKQELKYQNLEPVLRDQQASLEQWVDYFGSTDSNYMPAILKYWVFREVTSLQEYDKDNHKFPKREQVKAQDGKPVNITVNKFPDLNQEALGYVIDAVQKKYQGKSPEFEYDIQSQERENFEKYLGSENFAKLYAWSIELINPIPEHLLKITEGEWKKYQKGSNHRPLVDSIRRKGTGWCTAGENTARTQLNSGDFYVFYSLDDDKRPTIPRIAIRMEEDSIGEIRGIGYKQNMDPYIDNTDVLKNKLNEKNKNGESAFPDKDQYLKKDHDMRFLTEIERKTKANKPLAKEDFFFLYEIDNKIEGFGYQRDPRIEEIREKRSQKEDAPIVFGCKPEEITFNQEEFIKKEINKEKIKAYIDPLFPGIFKKDIEHIYTKFPEGKIQFKNIILGSGPKNAEEFKRTIESDGHTIYSNAKDILNKINAEEFEEFNNKKFELVFIKVSSLGFENGAIRQDIYDQAIKFGLEKCPAIVGPELRKQYPTDKQPLGEYLAIGMEPMTDSDGDPVVFRVNRTDDGKSYLNTFSGEPDNHWGAGDEWVFVRRKLES